MSSILVINAAGRETRVALVENGHIAEFYLERKKDRGIVGNIYKGRVVRVLPGMQAAFVDVGLEKAAFLYVTDVFYDPDFSRAQFELTEGEHEETPEVPEEIHEGTEEALAHGAGHALEFEVQELAPGELAPPADARRITGEFPAVTEPAVTEPSVPVVAAPGQSDAASEQAETTAPGVQVATGSEEPVRRVTAEIPVVGEPSVEGAAASPEGADAVAATSPESSEAGPDAMGLAPVTGEQAASASPEGGEAKAARPEGEVRGERRAPREERNREKHRRDRENKRSRDREEEKTKARKAARIEDLLKVGQEVLVQVSKDPIGTKGARLTCHISIPGRHLVFMPTVDHVGISRRIANEKERRRLREIVDRLRPPGTGFIVRTVAENVPQEKLEADIRFLIEVWNETVRKNEKRGGPGLMHSDLDLILRATRDLFAQDVEKLVVDDRDEYERICNFVSAQDPALRDRVILHDSDDPIFDAYGIEDEIRRATQRKVWLKSGGYLIMDQAEALTAIDVNSGRYVGKKSLEETITKINVEAAKEIVYQLRLRNIGGIIICDFIDMEKQQNRDKVFKTLQEALGRDKAKTNVLRISELGLVEMTRKRVRESIGRVLHEDCAYCEGQGFVKTATTVCYEIFRAIRREGPGYKDPTLVVNCHGDVARLLQGEERLELRHLMDRYNKSIQIKAQQNYHREQYDIYGRTASGSDHKLAGSFGHAGSAEGFGAPKQREQVQERSGNRERDRDRNRGRDRDRNRGRDRNREGDRNERGGNPKGEGERQGREGERPERGGNRDGERHERGGNPKGEGERHERGGNREGERHERGGNRDGERHERGGNREGERHERGGNPKGEGERNERGGNPNRDRGGRSEGRDRRESPAAEAPASVEVARAEDPSTPGSDRAAAAAAISNKFEPT